METSDESLARAAAGGDRHAFTLLLERHYDRVFRLAFRLTGAAAEAEDLTQDVCAALPSRLQGFRGEARFGTWLWRVVVNAAHDRRRKAATRARHAEGWGDWEVNRRAVQDEAAEVWKYADPSHLDLKGALAAQMACAPDNILIGEGIDGLLGYLVRLLVAPGDAVVTSDGAYPTFNYHVAGHGARLDFVPYRSDDHEDPDALIERARAVRPKLLYFANPDNPTGSFHDAATIERLIDAVPEETILVLDEAYSDLAPQGSLPPITLMRPNLLRFRTFSKAYGMAGVRVAYDEDDLLDAMDACAARVAEPEGDELGPFADPRLTDALRAAIVRTRTGHGDAR